MCQSGKKCGTILNNLCRKFDFGTLEMTIKIPVRNHCDKENAPEVVIIPLKEVRRFIFDCMKAVDTPDDHANQMAEILANADYRGHHSHGLNRLEMYVNQVQKGLCCSSARPEILKQVGATAWVDGKNGLGVVVANFCNKLAIKKAKEFGISIVSVKGSNHYGICAKYTDDAISEGLIQFTCTNTSPLAVPTRAKDAFFGTNPLALGAPASCQDSFLLDMATTTVAVGKIELAAVKKVHLPETWALNKEGKPEKSPKKALEAGKLSPLGGSEIMGGYKGSGLGCMVEVLCGILSGSNYGPNIEKWGKLTAPANLGHCFIVINPECFAPDFRCRLGNMLRQLRWSEPVDPKKKVLAAGDPEKKHMAMINKIGGIKFFPNQMSVFEKLAQKMKVRPLGTVC